MSKLSKSLIIFLICTLLIIGGMVSLRIKKNSGPKRSMTGNQLAPVEVAAFETGPIELQRIFSGELEAMAEFVVAPKISGRIERMAVDLGDTVYRGQVVVELDNDEYVHAVVQAEAELTVARANRAEAASALEIADRELNRIQKLRKSGIASESQYDKAKADQLAKSAQLKVANAQVVKAEAFLAAANIRLGYTRVTAGWSSGDTYRVVAERFADEGNTIAANTDLLSIVELDPISAVIYVTEKDFGRLNTGQKVFLTTDAYPDEKFDGIISRIAPVFRKATRQARVELTVKNKDHRLKPGMFVRAAVVLDQVSDVTIVPFQALTVRDGETGLFVVSENGKSVVWRTVKVGIRDGNRVQVEGKGLSGQVVTLGQQLVEDGSLITIPENKKENVLSGQKG